MHKPTCHIYLHLIAIIVLAVVMRGPISCVGPIAEPLIDRLQLAYSEYGFLSALPIFAFGAFSFFAAPLCRYLSPKQAIVLCLGLLCLGTLGRTVLHWHVLLCSSFFIGIAIALLNVLAPVIIKQAFIKKMGLAVGLYTATIGLSGAIGALSSVPMLHAFDSVRAPFALWAMLSISALLVWLLLAPSQAAPMHQQSRSCTSAVLLKSPTAWAVIFVMGLQSLLIYTVGAWLPAYLIDQGHTPEQAGRWFFIYMISGVPASLLTARLMRLCKSEFLTEVLLAGLYLFGVIGWLLGPTWLLPACICAGFSQGAMLSVAILLMSGKSQNQLEMLQISALSQGIGYIIACLGPYLYGLLYQHTHNWTLAWLCVGVVICCWAVAGKFASAKNTLT